LLYKLNSLDLSGLRYLCVGLGGGLRYLCVGLGGGLRPEEERPKALQAPAEPAAGANVVGLLRANRDFGLDLSGLRYLCAGLSFGFKVDI
jgi:hypothetical protein